MISKRLQPAFWFNDEPAAHLLKVHSRGLDFGHMQKFAAGGAAWDLSDIRPKPGYSFVHVISVAEGEVYGPNSNADYFNKEACVFRAPNGATAQLGPGLMGYHDATFMKHGAVYRNHVNSKKGATPLGSIAKAAMNQPMHRGELVLCLKDSEWADDLEKLANGEPVGWSMGAGVPNDMCSICLNRAANRSQYCEHARNHKLQLYKEGHQQFLINDHPHFHDISRVPVQAELIAIAMDKVAYAGNLHTAADHAYDEIAGCWLPVSLVNKIASRREADRYSIIHKMAEMEKRFQLQGMTPDEQGVAEAFLPEARCSDDEIVRALRHIPLNDLIHASSKHKILLPPTSFARIVIGSPDDVRGLSDLPAAVRSIFSRLLESGDAEELMSDGSYMPSLCCPSAPDIDKVQKLQPGLSLDPEAVKTRIIVMQIRDHDGPVGMPKAAAAGFSKEANVLATAYAKYQLGFLAGCGDQHLTYLTAMHNQVAV